MNNLTALDRLFSAAGFTLVRHTNHKIWRCPCGHTQMASSSSRHGGRGDQNAKALLARILRACTQAKEKA
jgi:hypothetical protein